MPAYCCQRNTAACLDCYSTSIVAYLRKPHICNNMKPAQTHCGLWASLSLLLWTAHPPAIGPIPSLSSLIPDWSTQSTGLLHNRDPLALGSLIALTMEAARTSETSVNNYFTQQYIAEDKSELHTRRRENLKSHKCTLVWIQLPDW
jgi:hypothetical protein